MTDCPGRDTLRQYIDDILPRTLNDDVESHVVDEEGAGDRAAWHRKHLAN